MAGAPETSAASADRLTVAMVAACPFPAPRGTPIRILRPDVLVTTLRLANVLGPHVTSPMTSYFRLPVVPTVLGFDPRLQFLHETDLLRVLAHAVHAEVPGTFNVAGDGVMLLSQAVRRLRKPTVALPRPAVGGLASVLKSARMADFSPEQLGLLTFGRGIDTDPDAHRARLRAGAHHRRGVRRLRDLDRPPAPARRAGRRRPGRVKTQQRI